MTPDIKGNAFETHYDSYTIAKVICKMINIPYESEEGNKIENAVFNLKIIAENPFNKDYYRTLYRTLEKLVDCYED